MHRVIASLKPNCGLKGAAILHNWLPCAIQSCGTQALAVPFCFGKASMEMDMRHNTLARICGGVVILDMAYMLYAGGSNATWTIFFVFLAFSILLNAVDERDAEIEILRTPKESTNKSQTEKQTDPRRYDPFYISDEFNPNSEKLKNEKDKKTTKL